MACELKNQRDTYQREIFSRRAANLTRADGTLFKVTAKDNGDGTATVWSGEILVRKHVVPINQITFLT